MTTTDNSHRFSMKVELCEPPSGLFMILAHGAGTEMNHHHLDDLSSIFVSLGISVVRFNFPYRENGKSIPDKMPVLMDSFRKVTEIVRDKYKPGLLFIGGHSMGGRVASMVASDAGFPVNGLVLFSYPLHPPGKPDKLRVDHLGSINLPVICFNGTRDEFSSEGVMEEQLVSLGENWTFVRIDEADHGMQVRKKSGRSREDVLAEMKTALKEWLIGLKID